MVWLKGKTDNFECARDLLIESQVPRTFWCEAVHTAGYLINRLPVKLLDKISPNQIPRNLLLLLFLIFSCGYG